MLHGQKLSDYIHDQDYADQDRQNKVTINLVELGNQPSDGYSDSQLDTKKREDPHFKQKNPMKYGLRGKVKPLEE